MLSFAGSARIRLEAGAPNVCPSPLSLSLPHKGGGDDGIQGLQTIHRLRSSRSNLANCSSLASPPPFWGRDRERGTFRGEIGLISWKELTDCVQDSFDRFQHLVIPDSQHRITFRLQEPVPYRVVSMAFRRYVAWAVHLDDKLSLMASKVCDEPSEWYLSAKDISEEAVGP